MPFPASPDRRVRRLALALAFAGAACDQKTDPPDAAPAQGVVGPAEAAEAAEAEREAERAATDDQVHGQGEDAAASVAAPDRDEASATPREPPSAVRLEVPRGFMKIEPAELAELQAFADHLRETGEHAGALWAGPLDGNGGRDVVIYVPPGGDPTAPLRRVYHFHGTYSERFEPPDERKKKRVWVGWDRLAQSIEAADRLQAGRDENVVLIYPFSAGKRMEPEWVGWSNKHYDRMWMKAESFRALHDDVTAVLDGELGVPREVASSGVVVEGHSAGGIAVWHVAEGGPDRGADLVTEFIFLDAGFQDWADGTVAAVKRHGLDARVTFVITDQGMADPTGGRTPWCEQAPERAATWKAVASFCEPLLERSPNKKPPGKGESCRTYAHDAEWWPRQKQFCADMKADMADVEGVVVHRTTVVHAKQIAHFLGGLELPEAWWKSASTR